MAIGCDSVTAAAPIGIIELGEVCARQRAICLDLFEQLGALVTAERTSAGADQQHYAAACHRHAWHAELWSNRAPSIPAVQVDGMFERSVARYRCTNEPVTDAASYRRSTEALAEELTELRARIDPLLDPSTVRVISLVLADLSVAKVAKVE